MVTVALFAEVGFGKPGADNGDHAFSDLSRAKTRDPRSVVWEKPFGTRLSWRFSQEKAGITPKLTTRDRLGENRSGTRLSWRSRFFPMVFTPKPATFDPLGKFPAEPVYHGDFARKSSDHAKTGDLRSAIWEKYFEICLVWRFSHEKAALTPKSTFRDRRLGKDIAEPVYHGDRQEPRDRIGKPMRNGEDIRIGKIKRGALVVAAIDDKRPQILVSPFQGVKALRIPDYSPFFSDRLLAS